MEDETSSGFPNPAWHPEGTVGLGSTANTRDAAALEAGIAALRDDAKRTDIILNSATDDAIIALNLGGRVTHWNIGAERVTGYAASEVLGRSAELIFTPEDRAAGVFVDELCMALDHGRAPNERWHLRKDGTRFWASGSMLPMLDTDGHASGFLNTFRDRTEARIDVERRDLLLGEMNHRIGNTLAVVRSIAAQTARHVVKPEEFPAAFDARLAALAHSHEVLTTAGTEDACLGELLKRTLVFLNGEAGRITIGGPTVHLPISAALMLSLAVHELATNAAKHGALSEPQGRVELSWVVQRGADGRRSVEIAWCERDGPAVMPPGREGFGSQLLRRGLGRQAGTTVTLDFAHGGLECRIQMPLRAAPDDK